MPHKCKEVLMADLSAILKQYQMNYKPITDATIAGINNNYKNQAIADSKVYNDSLSQANQTLAQVPSQFNAQRNAADETKNQAMSLLPSELANSGAATDSGANYVASTNIGNGFQNTMGTIGTSQNAAKQTAQNAINTLNANEAANQAKLSASKASDLSSAATTEMNNILSNGYSQYNTEASREATEAANAASLAEQKKEAADALAYKYYIANNNKKKAANTISNSDYNKYFKTAQTFFNSGSGGLPEKDAQGNYPSTQWSPQAAMKYLQGLKVPNSVKDKIASQIVRTFPEYSEIDRNGNAYTVPARTYTLADYIKWFATNQAQQNKNLYGK